MKGKRILVTGTRGKSSVVRILVDLLGLLGHHALGRITGVVPREICPSGQRIIERRSPPTVEEMRWWCKDLPSGALAVMENSAVRPELQHLGAVWLCPDLVVLTSARGDHREEWGQRDPLEVLLLGVPRGVPLLVPVELLEPSLIARERLGRPGPVVGAADLSRDLAHEPVRSNLALAAGALRFLGIGNEDHLIGSYVPKGDLWDFRVLRFMSIELAFAFTANDVESADALFHSLGWDPRRTAVWYNHRPDRPERLREFCRWIRRQGFCHGVFTGGSRLGLLNPPVPGRWVLPGSPREAIRMIGRLGVGHVFGCGNVAGLPLALPMIDELGGDGLAGP